MGKTRGNAIRETKSASRVLHNKPCEGMLQAAKITTAPNLKSPNDKSTAAVIVKRGIATSILGGKSLFLPQKTQGDCPDKIFADGMLYTLLKSTTRFGRLLEFPFE